MAAACLDTFGIRTVGKRETAMETAVTAFDAREAIGLLGRLAGAFAPDGEQSLVHRDLDVVWINARQIGVQHETIVFLLDVHPRHPLAGHHRAVVGTGLIEEAALEQAVEHLLHLALQRPLARLVVTDDIHHMHLLSG